MDNFFDDPNIGERKPPQHHSGLEARPRNSEPPFDHYAHNVLLYLTKTAKCNNTWDLFIPMNYLPQARHA